MQPRDSKELELDVTDAMYSSSQQINEQQKPGVLHVLPFSMYTVDIMNTVHSRRLCHPHRRPGS